MKTLWYLLTFLFGLLGVLTAIRILERLASGYGLFPEHLVIALIMLLLAWVCLRRARPKA